jgi:hypothetical protein
MFNKTTPVESISETKKERSLVSKLLWTAVFPFLAPYMFNIGGNSKEKLLVTLLVGTLGFNLYSQGILSSEENSKEKYNLHETSFIQNTYKINRTISEFQAFNEEIDQLYLKIGYVTASAITPIPLGKLGMLALGESQDSYDETIIMGSFNYYFADDKLGGSCDVEIDQENFDKLDDIKSYILGFREVDVHCEYAWGYKIHEMDPDSFGWAHAKLDKSLQQNK